MPEEQRVKIIGIEGCEPCDKVAEKLGDTVDYININSEEGRELIKKNKELFDKDGNIKVPLAIDEEGKFCEIFFDDDLVLAVCGDETRVLYEKEEQDEEPEEQQETE